MLRPAAVGAQYERQNTRQPPGAIFPFFFPDQITDWTIVQYVDQDPSSGISDYTGGSRSYDGHRGTDFLVPNFRFMDHDLVEILAAAAGEVVVAIDGFHDRVVADSLEEALASPVCTQGGQANSVVIRHANGYQTLYTHLKKGSVRVAVGERVAAGDTLGIIGSSGCSTGPHLHFEVYDAAHLDLWHEPPSYETPFGLMDYYVLGADVDFRGVRKDPPDNIAGVPAGSAIKFALSLAGIEAGQEVRFEATGPDEVYRWSLQVSSSHVESFWYWRPPPFDDAGEWVLNAYVDDTDLQVNHALTVE